LYWIAFTLGFFGSLHCIGMCGPLAMAVTSIKSTSGYHTLRTSLAYNIGRTIGYIILGLVFGILGSLVAFSGAQKAVSVLLGILMILIGLFSVNPDRLIAKIPSLNKVFLKINQLLSSALQKSKNVPSIWLGLINGFLPCGLVYLALAGAVSLSNIGGSVGFMLFFGLGTFPAMVGVSLSHQLSSTKVRMSLRKLYPIISLVMGTYLVYRGLMSKVPLELNFFEALQNPIMCH